MKKKMELVAPAGDPYKMRVAVRYGADAVYFSDRFFGLRGKAGNFTLKQMKEGVAFVHENGRKAYCTVNLFARNRDFRRISNHLRILADDIKVDAVIVADPGVLQIAGEVVPELPVHLSTQANTLNLKACEFWAANGVKRIVLARELSFPEVAYIAENSPAETEVFIHGAVCIAYSGRCFLSNYMAKYRDANRGICANSCRWNYTLTEAKRDGEVYELEEDRRGTLFFNSKDLCLLRRLPDLCRAGVNALKIEGRTKSMTYCAVTTAVYRAAIDSLAVSEECFYAELPRLEEELFRLGGRGYTEGLFSRDFAAAYNYEERGFQGDLDCVGLLLQKKICNGEELFLVSVRKKISRGDRLVAFMSGAVEKEFIVGDIFSHQNGSAELFSREFAISGEEVLLTGLSGLADFTVLRSPAK
jgi:putative protease